MFDSVDDRVLDLMLTDPEIKGIYGNKVNREAIRMILSEPVAENHLGVTKGLPVGSDACERINIELEADQTVAWIILGQPLLGEPSVTTDEVLKKLQALHIVYGINHGMISRLVNNPIYQKAFIIARGEAPKHGIDSEIKFYFDTKKELRPIEQENGEINFREINFVQSVKKGDLLCEIILGTPGVNGTTVTGESIKAKGGESCKLPAGRNTNPSGDNMRLYASCDGEATYKNRQIHIDRVLYVDNVDLSTGNIRHIGSVHVRGRVCEGFSLKATENITVNEVIENAEVSAGGSIRVHKGIKGKTGGSTLGSVTAGKNVYAPFIEHMKVTAGEDVYSSVLFDSKISCKGKIIAQGEKGYILGGTCTAYEVEATRIGNDANVSTSIVILGIDEMRIEIEDLEADASIQEKTVVRLQKHLQDSSNPNKVETQKELLGAIYKKNETVRKVRQRKKELDGLKDKYEFDVKVRETIYPNVGIKIDGVVIRNMESLSGCIFFRVGNHVVVRSYKK